MYHLLSFQKKSNASFYITVYLVADASTCDLLIISPVHLNTEADMKEIMKSVLVDCIGFGLL